MKGKKSLLLLSLVITFTFMSIQPNQALQSKPTQTTDDIRIIRLVLGNLVNLTVNQNDTFPVFMSLENIANETLFDISFNFTAKEGLYEIVDSTNKSQTSSQFAFYKLDHLFSGDIFIFNATLKVLSNTTNTIKQIDPLRIDYKFGEFKIPQFAEAPSLDIFLKNTPVDEKALREREFGTLTSDLLFFAIFFILPLSIGAFLSIMFGRRQNKR